MWSSLQCDIPLSQTNPEARTDLDCVSVWSTSLSQTCAAIAKRNHVSLERDGTRGTHFFSAYKQLQTFAVIEYLYKGSYMVFLLACNCFYVHTGCLILQIKMYRTSLSCSYKSVPTFALHLNNIHLLVNSAMSTCVSWQYRYRKKIDYSGLCKDWSTSNAQTVHAKTQM